MAPQINTAITKMFGIKHPILLAGMNVAAGPDLAAAVTNAGGLGVIGGVGYTPQMLREQIADLKAALNDKDAPFGVDLLLPAVGAGARKTNYDYTHGTLPELIDTIIASGAKLFVCAVGVPPKEVVDKLHAAKIPVLNMIGHPKHVKKALAVGVDMICAQGGEGGGHTGDIPTSILLPQCVELCNKAKSPLTGDKVHVIAAGAMYRGSSLAAALSYGCEAVWVGTRFVAAKEAGAPKGHQEAYVSVTPFPKTPLLTRNAASSRPTTRTRSARSSSRAARCVFARTHTSWTGSRGPRTFRSSSPKASFRRSMTWTSARNRATSTRTSRCRLAHTSWVKSPPLSTTFSRPSRSLTRWSLKRSSTSSVLLAWSATARESKRRPLDFEQAVERGLPSPSKTRLGRAFPFIHNAFLSLPLRSQPLLFSPSA